MFASPNSSQHSTNSIFGSPSIFGQNNHSNIFSPKPFNSPNPFGSSIGMPNSGGTPTVAFGQTSSPVSSTTVFGQNNHGNPFAPKPFNSHNPFGSTIGMSNSGGTSTMAFGQTSAPLSSTTLFGQNNHSNLNPFSPFGSTIGMSNSGGTSTMAFGQTSSPLSSTTVFGQNNHGNPFGPKPFNSPSPFASPTGLSNSGGTSTMAFGQTSSPVSSTTVFGQNNQGNPFDPKPFNIPSPFASPTGLSNPGGTSAFAFGQTSSPLSSTISTSIGGSVLFGVTNLHATTASNFGTQIFLSGSQFTTPTFERRGSRVKTYKKTTRADGSLLSISSMPVYKNKSHEELRWEEKVVFGLHTSNSNSASVNPVSPLVQSNTFASNQPTFTSPRSGRFSISPFSSSSFTNSLTTSPFASSAAFMSSPTISSSISPTLTNAFSFPTASNPFASPTPSYSFHPTVPTTSFIFPVFNISSSGNSSWTTSVTTSSTSATAFAPLFGPHTSPPGSGPTSSSAFTSIPSIPTMPVSVPASGVTSGINFTWSQPSTLFQPQAPSAINPVSFKPGIRMATADSGRSAIAQQSSQSTAVGQPSSVVSPFGTLPAIPQMSIDGTGSTPLVRYGISSIPVQDKPAPVRVPSLLTTRHLSQRIRLPVQKYDPKFDRPKVPFFCDDKEIPNTLFVPRENPRQMVIRHTDRWPLGASSEKVSRPKLSSIVDDKGDGEGDVISDELNVEQTNDSTRERDLPLTVPEVVALLPQLRLSGYYTEPPIQELEAKERAEPGFFCHMKDFVIGRLGYGKIKFLGETDVRKLDPESLVQFNNREVIVYRDEDKKPPVGEGLNQPAEVTLLNIRYIDKKTGMQFIDGSKIDKYREMLIKKTKEQGAEFVSYDPIGGEWKFRVKHF